MRPLQQTWQQTVFILVICTGTAACRAGELRIPLVLSSPGPVWDRPWPVTTGIPLPRGVVKNVATLAVVDDNGKAVPADFKSCWLWRPDNSVQWGNVLFVARARRKYSVVRGRAKNRAHVLPQVSADTLIVTRQGEVALRFATGEKKGLQDVLSNGNRVLGAVSQRLVTTDGTVYTGRAERVSVETTRPGYVETTVREEGSYVAPNGVIAAAYLLRFTLYGDLPLVRVEPLFTWLTDDNNLKVRDLALELSVPQENQPQEVYLGPPDAPQGEALRIPWTPGTIAIGAAQETYRHYGNLDCHAEFYRRSQDGTETKIREAEKSLGGISWTASRGVAMALAKFWQQFPKEWEVHKDKVILHLWSSRGEPLDFTYEGVKSFWNPKTWELFHRTGFIGHLKWIEDNLVKPNARGLQKHHEIWIDLSPTAGENAASLARWVDDPPLAIPDPSWTCSTGALHIPVAPRDKSSIPEIERVVDGIWTKNLELCDSFGDYGWWAYGGGPHFVYLSQNGRPAATAYRFFNEDYFRPRHGFVQYIRSGDRALGDWLYARLYHLLDIEVSHVAGTGPESWKSTYRGHLTCSSGVYWAHDTNSTDVMAETICVSLEMPIWAYAMTGDERWREFVFRWAERLRRLRSGTEFGGKGGWPEGYINSHAGYTASWARGVTTCLENLALAYEATGDNQLKEMCASLGGRLLDKDQPCGFRPTVDGFPHSEMYYITRPFLAYYRLTGDGLAVDALKRSLLDTWLLDLSHRGSDVHWAQDYALGYSLTNDRRYLEEALFRGKADVAMYEELLSKPWSEYPEEQQLVWIQPSTVKDVLGGVPMLAAALSRPELKAHPPAAAEHRLFATWTRQVVLEKPFRKSVYAEFYSKTPSLRVFAPDGRPIPGEPMQLYPISSWGTIAGYRAVLTLPANSPGGLWRVTADKDFWGLRGNFPRAVADASLGIEFDRTQAAHAFYLSVPKKGTNEITMDVRDPDTLEVAGLNGEALKPTPQADNPQRLTFPVPEAARGKVLRLTTQKGSDNYALPRTTGIAWVADARADRAFLPPASINTPAAALAPEVDGFVPGPTLVLKKGLVLHDGDRLVLPRFSPDFTQKPGALEFWIQLQFEPRLLKAPSVDLGPFLSSGDLVVRLMTGKAYGYGSFYATLNGPENYTYAQGGCPARRGEWHHVAITWYPIPKAKVSKLSLVCALDGQPPLKVLIRDLADAGFLPRTQAMPAPEVTLGLPPVQIPSLRGGIALAGLSYFDVPRHVNLSPPSSMLVEYETSDPARDEAKPTVYYPLSGSLRGESASGSAGDAVLHRQ